jgi:hypothetical protein
VAHTLLGVQAATRVVDNFRMHLRVTQDDAAGSDCPQKGSREDRHCYFEVVVQIHKSGENEVKAKSVRRFDRPKQ